MASLQEYAVDSGDIFRPRGELDVLAYYGMIAQKLEKYLSGRKLATRVWPPKGRVRSVMIRSPPVSPLHIRQLAGSVTLELMDVRAKYRNLDAARHVLSSGQALVWYYFPTRRMIELYYALNREGEGRVIDRVLYEIGRGRGVSGEDAIEAAALLASAAMDDGQVRELVSGKPFVSWTGCSFNLVLSLAEAQPARFYEEQLAYSGRGRTLTDRLIDRVNREAGVPVTGGRARLPGYVTVDPSQTPSGHLCQVPLGSLLMRDAMTIEGVSVPLTLDMLRREEVAYLQSLTPGRIIDELDGLAQRLP